MLVRGCVLGAGACVSWCACACVCAPTCWCRCCWLVLRVVFTAVACIRSLLMAAFIPASVFVEAAGGVRVGGRAGTEGGGVRAVGCGAVAVVWLGWWKCSGEIGGCCPYSCLCCGCIWLVVLTARLAGVTHLRPHEVANCPGCCVSSGCLQASAASCCTLWVCCSDTCRACSFTTCRHQAPPELLQSNHAQHNLHAAIPPTKCRMVQAVDCYDCSAAPCGCSSCGL